MLPPDTLPEIPAQMSAVVVQAFDRGLDGAVVEQRPVPQPGAGEVLVRIAAAPINPSDLSFVQGNYIRKTLPVVAGFEGAGTVVAVGEGVNAAHWINRRVHCFAGDGDGTWAAFMRTKAEACTPLPDHLSFEQGAMLVVNPLTAWALLDIARRENVRAVVQSAAAGALGKMIIRLGQRMNITVINVVRRAEQIAELQAFGATHVFNSTDPDFAKQLRAACKETDAKLAFDAVSGDMTGQLLQAMPNGSRVIIYGGLAGQPITLSVDQFIMRNKSVAGFWLTTWMPSQDRADLRRALEEVQELSTGVLQSEVRARFALEDAPNALRDYSDHMSGGKVLFTPS